MLTSKSPIFMITADRVRDVEWKAHPEYPHPHIEQTCLRWLERTSFHSYGLTFKGDIGIQESVEIAWLAKRLQVGGRLKHRSYLRAALSGWAMGSNTIMTHVFPIDNAVELNRGHHKSPSPQGPSSQNDPMVCRQGKMWVETDLRIVYLRKRRKDLGQRHHTYRARWFSEVQVAQSYSDTSNSPRIARKRIGDVYYTLTSRSLLCKHRHASTETGNGYGHEVCRSLQQISANSTCARVCTSSVLLIAFGPLCQ